MDKIRTMNWPEAIAFMRGLRAGYEMGRGFEPEPKTIGKCWKCGHPENRVRSFCNECIADLEDRAFPRTALEKLESESLKGHLRWHEEREPPDSDDPERR